MPITPAQPGRASDRRAASPTRHTDVSKSDWPVITKVTYDSMARNKTPDDQLNLRMKRLCVARIELGRTLLAFDGALHDHNPEVKGNKTDDQSRAVYNKLRSMRNRIEKEFKAFPLEVRNG